MDKVDAMPPDAVESFAGVGNPFSLGPVRAGQTVVDVGSGGGFDSLIAAEMVGPRGIVIGVDMTEPMLEKARLTAMKMGLSNVEYRSGYAEELPVEDGRVSTLSFADYKIPTVSDLPQLETVLLESDEGLGPYKVRSIGEAPLLGVAPAIANAVQDAIGVRVQHLPITAEKVYQALKESR